MNRMNKLLTDGPESYELTSDEKAWLTTVLADIITGSGTDLSYWKPDVNVDGLLSWSKSKSVVTPTSRYIIPKLRIQNSDGAWQASFDGGATYQTIEGNVAASGKVGPSGITPQFRINSTTNYWEVSIDEGATFTSLNVSATGPQGDNGTDGVSPSITAESIANGHRVIITDATHPATNPLTFDVMNGQDGAGASYTFDTNTLSGAGTAGSPYGVSDTWILNHHFATSAGLTEGLQYAMTNAGWAEVETGLTSVVTDGTTVSGDGSSTAQIGLTKTVTDEIAKIADKLEAPVNGESNIKIYGYEVNGSADTAKWLDISNRWATSQDVDNALYGTNQLKERYIDPIGNAVNVLTAASAGWNGASANALSEAKTWVNQQNFATSAGLDANKQYAMTTNGWSDFTIPSTSGYLPLSGGAVSGQLEVHGGSNFDTDFIKLTREGNSCGARIGLGSDSTNGTLALKTFNAQGQNTVQVNVKYNTNNNELVQVQKGGNEVGYLIPAKIHQGSYTPSENDGILHIILES